MRLRYGGFWRRAGAHFIDLAIFFGSTMVVAAFGLALLGVNGRSTSQIFFQMMNELKCLAGILAGLCVSLVERGDHLNDVFQQAFSAYPIEAPPPLSDYYINI